MKRMPEAQIVMLVICGLLVVLAAAILLGSH